MASGEGRCERLCQRRMIQLPLFHDHRPEPSQRWQQTLSIGDSKIEQETDQGIGCGVSARLPEECGGYGGRSGRSCRSAAPRPRVADQPGSLPHYRSGLLQVPPHDQGTAGSTFSPTASRIAASMSPENCARGTLTPDRPNRGSEEDEQEHRRLSAARPRAAKPALEPPCTHGISAGPVSGRL